MKFAEYLKEKFTEQGKLVKTFKKGNRWCRVGKVSRKEWTVITDSGIYDSFGSKADAFKYAQDYVDDMEAINRKKIDDLNKGWI